MKRRALILFLALITVLAILPGAVFATPIDIIDTDYDGIPDNVDNSPDSNVFTGTYKSGDFSINLNYKMDYREFFGDNTKYNEAIADFSIWAAQFTYENEDNGTTYTPGTALPSPDGGSVSKVYHIDQLMQVHGMENVVDYKLADGYFNDAVSMPAYSDDDISEAYYGHHKVLYNGETIEVVAVFVRGTNGTIQEWSSNFNVGNLYRYGQEYDAAEGKLQFPNAQWRRKSNHRGFDISANRIREGLADYVEQYLDPEATPVFWISGHSRGGAISNILASYLIDEGNKVFAYTFASPNTTANTEASAAKYDCIFNLVNGDDFVPRLPMPEWGFSRYGRTATLFASTATNSQRSNYLGNTSYNHKSDSDLKALCNKFVAMTVNNSGRNDGWRDVYVYHCGHQHADEQSGEYRTGCTRTRGWNELIGWGESMFNGWSQRVQRYAYWSSADSGICETPAYAMQVLAELMGNLSLSGGWDYLTTNKLADRYDFGKTSLISYATGIIDPHYPENYYLTQELVELQGDPDAAYTTGNSLYLGEDNRPSHVHSYTTYIYEGHEPNCTENGLGYMECKCSEVNSDWYDDIIQDIEIPALGHEWGEPTELWDETNHCTLTYVCTRDESHTETHRGVKVFVVDQTGWDKQLYIHAWNENGSMSDWPGTQMTLEDSDVVWFPVGAPLNTTLSGTGKLWSFTIDADKYSGLLFNDGNGKQTQNQAYLTDAGENDYVVYYLWDIDSYNFGCSAGTDYWPAVGELTAATCTEAGFTTYTGRFTGEQHIVPGEPALGHDFGEWTITTAPSCTEAGEETRSCSRCGAVETRTVDALGHTPAEAVEENYVEPTVQSEGGFDSVVYCSVCGAELSREHVTLPILLPEITGHSLNAAGVIQVNIYANVPESLVENEKIFYSFGGADAKQPVTGDMKTSNGYRFTIACPAKNLHDAQTLSFFDENDNPINLKEGEDQKQSHSYSVQDYLDYVIENESLEGLTEEQNSRLLTLCKAMSDYGHYAQVEKDYEIDDLSTLYLTEEITAVTADDVFEHTDGTNIRYYGISLLMRSETVIRVYFKITGEAENYKAYIDGSTEGIALTASSAANYYYVDLEGINAKDFGVTHSFVVDNRHTQNGTATDSASVTGYSVHCYVATVLRSDSTTENLRNVVKAIKYYGEKAAQYFAAF